MKQTDGYDKLRGGYYTPKPIASFIADWAIRTPADSVLEPSCGDGSFLGAIVGRIARLGATRDHVARNVLGIEIDRREAKKAKETGASVVCDDFFTYYGNAIDGKLKFDAVLGNPPFIRYQNFTEKYRKIAFSLMNKHGFHPNRLTNIWIPFLMLACKALKPGGRVGMVIPAELFQVDYAAEARQFLGAFFDSLTIVTFKKLVFDDIQQEVVLLLGENGGVRRGIRVVELDGSADLNGRVHECLRDTEVKKLDHGKEKWVKYYLTNKELSLLDQLNADPRISSASDLYEINVGLVSGENDFFVMNEDAVKRNRLEKSVAPIISRTDQVKGILLTPDDYKHLVRSGKNVFLFTPDDLEPSAEELRYIEWGEAQGYSQNYKCRIRPKWYCIPQSWTPDAFLTRQVHMYPRIVLNEKKALATDTLHKVRFHAGISGRTVASAFLNAYTFAFSETLGRSYGGGVLTFEPGEMRRMRIPMSMADHLDADRIDDWQRKGQIGKILEYTDDVLLRNGLNLSSDEISSLHDIWIKMRDRRMRRKNQGRKPQMREAVPPSRKWMTLLETGV